jgi:hypothetical protein
MGLAAARERPVVSAVLRVTTVLNVYQTSDEIPAMVMFQRNDRSLLTETVVANSYKAKSPRVNMVNNIVTTQTNYHQRSPATNKSWLFILLSTTKFTSSTVSAPPHLYLIPASTNKLRSCAQHPNPRSLIVISMVVPTYNMPPPLHKGHAAVPVFS